MAHDAGFEMTSEQLFKGWNDAANSVDPYDSDNHRMAPKSADEKIQKKVDTLLPPST